MRPEAAQIVEMDAERDRKTCITLFARVTGANRELAQWLLDHSRYSAPQVAEWLGCGETRIKDLRNWAKRGFEGNPFRPGNRRARVDATLKSQDNSPDEDGDTEDGGDGVAAPEEIKSNIFDTIDREKAVARAYKKILAASTEMDQIAKDEISAAIETLITTWQSLQRTLASGRKR